MSDTRISELPIWTGQVEPIGDVPISINGVTYRIQPSQLKDTATSIIEVVDYSALPGTGESGKLYVMVNNGSLYRWNGAGYDLLSENQDLDSVTIEGNTTSNEIVVGSIKIENIDNTPTKIRLKDGYFELKRIFPGNLTNYSTIFLGGFNAHADVDSPFVNAGVNTDAGLLVSTRDDNNDGKNLVLNPNDGLLFSRSGNRSVKLKNPIEGQVDNSSVEFNLPNKPSGSYTLATTEDSNGLDITMSNLSTGLTESEKDEIFQKLGSKRIIEVTQAQYDALSISDKNNTNRLYYIESNLP